MPASSNGVFSGQVALVTGASSGAGRSIALALADRGASVCLAGRDASRLEEVEAKAAGGSGRSVAHAVDLTRDEDLHALAERVVGELGGLDILVHAAGVMSPGRVQDSALPDLDRQYQTNLRAPYALTQLLLPSLRDGHGQIVFINSTQGAAASPEASQYAATKHGLRAVADGLRAEVNRDGVRVLTVLLGQTATPMQEGLHKAQGRRYQPELMIQPGDVAEMVIGALLVARTAEVTEFRMLPAKPPDADFESRGGDPLLVSVSLSIASYGQLVPAPF